MVDLTTFSDNKDSLRFERTMQGPTIGGVKSLHISDKGIPKKIISEIPRAEQLVNDGTNTDSSIYFTEDGNIPAYSFIGNWDSIASQVLVYYEPGYVPPVFSPATLFEDGSEGVWFDLSDTSTLYQDTSSNISVTSDGDSISYIADKSGNGNDVVASTSVGTPTWEAASGSGVFNESTVLTNNINRDLWETMHREPFTAAFVISPGLSQNPDNYGGFLATTTSLSSSTAGMMYAYDDRSSEGRVKGLSLLSAKGTLGTYAINNYLSNLFTMEQFQRLIIETDPNSGDAATSQEVYYEGVAQADNNIGTPTSTAILDRDLTVGGASGGGGLGYIGRISQIILINRHLTLEEKTKLNEWLLNKY